MDKNNAIKTILCLIILGIAYYVQVRLNLFTCDDFRYTLNQENWKKIVTISDIVSSQLHAYSNENGRFIVHCIVQFFAAIAGMEILRCCNAIMFVFLILGILKLTQSEPNSSSCILLPIIFLALFLLLPVPGATLLGNIACSVNYLWASCIYIWFTWMYFHFSTHESSVLKKSLIIIFSLFAGSFQESFAIGISCALFLYLLVYHQNIQSQQIIMSLCFWGGCAFLCLAPGNFIRAAALGCSGGDVVGYLHRAVYAFIHAPVFVIASFILLKRIGKINRLSFFLYSAAVISILFAIGITTTGPHQLTAIALFSSIIVFQIIFSCIQSRSLVKLSLCCSAAICLFFVPVYKQRAQTKQAHEEMCDFSNNYLISEKYDKLSYGKKNYLQRAFTTTEDMNAFSLSAFSKCHDLNPEISLRLPKSKESIGLMCRPENRFADNIFHSPNEVFYVIRFPKLNAPSNILVQSNLSKLAYVKSLLFGGNQYKEQKFKSNELPHFELDGYTYLIVYNQYDSPIRDIVLLF